MAKKAIPITKTPTGELKASGTLGFGATKSGSDIKAGGSTKIQTAPKQ
jgi:hypothetical protein